MNFLLFFYRFFPILTLPPTPPHPPAQVAVYLVVANYSYYSHLLETYSMHFNLQDIYTFASKILRGTNSEFRRNVLIEIIIRIIR